MNMALSVPKYCLHKAHVSCLFLGFHSSEQSAKADAHKELIRTLRELKVHLPADKKAKGKASTLATLKYALRSVKQVKGTCTLHVCSNPVKQVGFCLLAYSLCVCVYVSLCVLHMHV